MLIFFALILVRSTMLLMTPAAGRLIMTKIFGMQSANILIPVLAIIGGPRFMAQLYQDAINLARRFGKPDLFITFTCNPAWKEIDRELHKPPQTANDRPDLCARVFNLKLRAMMDDIVNKGVLGKVVAYVYSIEFQKRGLPHCHALFILHPDDKPKTPEDVEGISGKSSVLYY